jgi:hypothetical protein
MTLRIIKGPTAITLPIYQRTYSQGWIDFEVVERTINRTLVSDFVAFKRRFSIEWELASGELVAELLDLYLDKEDVIFEETQADNSVKTWTCRLSISDDIVRDIEVGNFAFSGFGITLEEV